MKLPPLDLTVLAPGEKSELSFENDYCAAIEDFPAKLSPGNCARLGAGEPTIFTEPLSVLKCGLVVLKSQAEGFQRLHDDQTFLLDAQIPTRIARFLKPYSFPGKVYSRFAPVLFDAKGEKDGPVDAALKQTLGIATPSVRVSDLDINSFVDVLGDGYDVVDDRGQLKYQAAGEAEHAQDDGIDLGRKLRGLKEGLRAFRDGREIAVGMRDDGEAEFRQTPLFFVGRLPGGRLGGLACVFVIGEQAPGAPR